MLKQLTFLQSTDTSKLHICTKRGFWVDLTSAGGGWRWRSYYRQQCCWAADEKRLILTESQTIFIRDGGDQNKMFSNPNWSVWWERNRKVDLNKRKVATWRNILSFILLLGRRTWTWHFEWNQEFGFELRMGAETQNWIKWGNYLWFPIQRQKRREITGS